MTIFSLSPSPFSRPPLAPATCLEALLWPHCVMPADARALLRAAASSSAQGATEGIKDRFASYHPKTRALRCLACNYLVIKHESLWASHAASKSHRSNAAQVRKSEEEHEEQQKQQRRAAQVDNVDGTGGKRKGHEEEDQNGDEEAAKRARKSETAQPVDAEWERFQREVLNAPSAEQQPSLTSYADATIEVGPELRRAHGDDREETREVEEEEDEEDELGQANKVETEAERRTRLEREEREEILARFEEEQRVQDEADERVAALKSRFERLKQARAGRRA